MGVLGNIGRIERQWKHGCSFDPEGKPRVAIIVETALTAAIPTLLSLSQFSCMDILKLRAGISYRCGRILKAAISGAHPPSAIDGAHFWYNVTGSALVERALWYYFLADLASEYVANWSSLMYAAARCELPYSGTLAATVGVYDYLGDPGDQYLRFDGGGSNECASIGTTGVLVNPGCEVSIACNNLNMLCPGYAVATTLQVQMYDTAAGETVVATGIWNQDGSNGNANIAVQERLPGGNLGTTYRFKVLTDGNPSHCTQVTGGDLLVTTYGEAVKLNPTGCVPKQGSL